MDQQTNDLTDLAGVVAMQPLGGKYKDKNGKYKDVPIDEEDFKMDFSGLSMSGGSGDDSGGDVDPHPAIGANYYAGSLADGEITGRYLLYQRDESVAEDPTTSKTVPLLRDVGAKFNMAGDGATFLVHVQKTAMTAGAKGDVTDIKLNYDENNVAKDGYFTTTSYYPIYIKSSDLATTNELDIPVNGIGENLSGKNFLAPHLKVKFNGDGTMTYYSVTGYDNDGNTAGATGANYEIVVDVISTFSTQTAVAQLPSSINLFTGSATGNVALSGISKFYENSMDGLEITLDDYIYFYNSAIPAPIYRIKSSDFITSNIFNIPKEKLINGININIVLEPFIDTTSNKNIPHENNIDNSSGVKWQKSSDGNFLFKGITKSNIIVGKSSLNSDFEVTFKDTTSPHPMCVFNWNVVKISPHKN